MPSTTEYRNAYEAAKKELAELIMAKDQIEKRMIIVRKSFEALAALCESENIEVQSSPEAAYLIETSTISEEIKQILRAKWPDCVAPQRVKEELEHLGHDLRKYQNPQSAVHMALKRLADAQEVQEIKPADGGRQVYRCPPTLQQITEGAAMFDATYGRAGRYRSFRGTAKHQEAFDQEDKK